jgi:hypothetical protein
MSRCACGENAGKPNEPARRSCSNALINIIATAPDGHDVLTETGPNESGNWRVTSMSPAAGTLVMRSQPITMTVVRDYNAPS